MAFKLWDKFILSINRHKVKGLEQVKATTKFSNGKVYKQHNFYEDPFDESSDSKSGSKNVGNA